MCAYCGMKCLCIQIHPVRVTFVYFSSLHIFKGQIPFPCVLRNRCNALGYKKLRIRKKKEGERRRKKKKKEERRKKKEGERRRKKTEERRKKKEEERRRKKKEEERERREMEVPDSFLCFLPFLPFPCLSMERSPGRVPRRSFKI